MVPPPETPAVVEEFKPDASKTEAENATAKEAFDKVRNDAKAAAEAEAAKTPEQKAADKKAADEAAAAAKQNDTKVTPFKVEEIKLPEGVEADAATQAEFVTLVNEEGIPRSAVAKLVALQAKAMNAASEAGSKLFADTQAAWQKEAKADPDIGGDKLGPTLANVSKVIDLADDPAKLREVMDLTGAGNHPVVIKWLNKISPTLVEPGAAVSGKPGEVALSAADRIYGKK